MLDFKLYMAQLRERTKKFYRIYLFRRKFNTLLLSKFSCPEYFSEMVFTFLPMKICTITKTKLSEKLEWHFFRFITWLKPTPLTFKSYVSSVKIQFVFLECFKTQNFQKHFLNFLEVYELETSQKTSMQHI